jgi:lipoyl(octanoyl) transferase
MSAWLKLPGVVSTPVVRWLGTREYLSILQAMQEFTALRKSDTPNEIWLLEHLPVYTVGVRSHTSLQIRESPIPVVKTDRGGLITYHAPGQLVAYVLFDLNRLKLGIRSLVSALEQATIDLLAQYGLKAHARPKAPGVYVGEAKIAFVGLKVKRGLSYHGLSLNVDLDLAPFHAITPCGIEGLEVTRLKDLGVGAKVHEVAVPWLTSFLNQVGISHSPHVVHDLPAQAQDVYSF